VINGPEWLLESPRAISTNPEQTVSKTGSGLAHPVKTLTKSFCDSLGHIFAGQRSKLFGQLVGLCILYV